MTSSATFSLALPNETATAHLMADLALLTGPGDVITLSGDLGAGKTSAARAMIRYLADDDEMEVPSPTFTLAQTYDLPSLPLITPTSIASMMLRAGRSAVAMPEGVVALIEWPEAHPVQSADRIDIALGRPLARARAAESPVTANALRRLSG
jgi:tRNA threonylcarbamoyl adenosine modification protein YjeE